MKAIGQIFLGLFILFILVVIFALGYLGLIPGVAAIFGANKPRDLGIKYSEADRTTARGKSQIEYATLPEDVSPENSRETFGSRPATTEFTSSEITALMNNRPWRYWPYQNVQVKLNADGSAEISGVLLKDKLPGYGAKIGAPKEAIDLALKFLPTNPVFYVKGKAALTDNRVSVFEPQVFEIGRVKLPVSLFLAFSRPTFDLAIAQSTGGIAEELGKVQNKRQLIIDYINRRLSLITGFYAKSAYFAENRLIFDGTLPEKEATTR